MLCYSSGNHINCCLIKPVLYKDPWNQPTRFWSYREVDPRAICGREWEYSSQNKHQESRKSPGDREAGEVSNRTQNSSSSAGCKIILQL